MIQLNAVHKYEIAVIQVRNTHKNEEK